MYKRAAYVLFWLALTIDITLDSSLPNTIVFHGGVILLNTPPSHSPFTIDLTFYSSLANTIVFRGGIIFLNITPSHSPFPISFNSSENRRSTGSTL